MSSDKLEKSEDATQPRKLVAMPKARVEIETEAALFVVDCDEPAELLFLDQGEQRVGMRELLAGEPPSLSCVEALTRARPELDPSDEFSERWVKTHDSQVAKAKRHPLRVYRVRIVAEYERLPQEEAQRWVDEARARDEARREAAKKEFGS